MDEKRTRVLLGNLCTELGFCLPPEAGAELVANPPSDVIAFTEAVITAEGLEPDLVDRRLYRQIRDMIQAALDED